MEIKIGVQHSPRELVVESNESPEGPVEKHIADALAGDGLLALTDSRGRRVLVPPPACPTSRSAGASAVRSASAPDRRHDPGLGICIGCLVHPCSR